MKRLLVVRNDKLGDFMLAWPAFAMLKQSAPEWHITALVPAYTESLARYCPYIDDVIVDAGKKGEKEEQRQTLMKIKQARFDAVINFFSDTYNALTVFKAGIPFRMAPATKFIQVLYNHRVVQRRSRSLKPEYEYNLDLARAFLLQQGLTVCEPAPPYLSFAAQLIAEQKTKLAQQLQISAQTAWVFVHAGSGGSANNLSLAQYAKLIVSILCQTSSTVVLTAGPGEREKVGQLFQQVRAMLLTIAETQYSGEQEEEGASLKDAPLWVEQFVQRMVIYDKNAGLIDFAQSLACANVFIAGSTGPLHICGALNVPTIGFYPSKRSATPLRWQTINQADRRLAFSPQQGKPTEDDLTTIDMDEVIPQCLSFIQRYV